MEDVKCQPKKSKKAVVKRVNMCRIVRRQNLSLNDIKEMAMRRRKEWMVEEPGCLGKMWKKGRDVVAWVNWRRQRRMAGHNLSMILLCFTILMLSITTIFLERHKSVYLSDKLLKVNPIVEMSKAVFQK